MDLYSILSHSTRRKILQLLEREGVLSFSAFLPLLKLDTSGKLNFHIKKMGSLIKKSGKNYMLTEEGKLALKILKLNDNILSGTAQIDHIDKDEISKVGILRIGIIICLCAEEISDVLDIEDLKRHVTSQKKVVSVRIVDRLCGIKEVKGVKEWIDQFFINRLVVAACSPGTRGFAFEDIFEGIIGVEVIKNTEFANIREQCVWVNDSNPTIALEKAKILIEAAVNRVILQEDIEVKEIITRTQKSVAVIGGGLAGINLALSFARAGLEVYLIEKTPTLGGKIARWNNIYDVKECASCYLTELISLAAKEKNVKIFTNTTVEKVSGHVGNFEIELLIHPRFVDADDCTGCKRCINVCPNETENEYEFSLTKRKIIHIPFSNAHPYASCIDEKSIEDCRNCRLCEETCLTHAINLDDKPRKLRINVGAKILAIGSDLFQDLLAYQHNPQNDILTSAEFERIIASDGPTRGKLVKLSDGKPPKSISIIQCVNNIDVCSNFCCNLTKKYIEEIEKRLPDCELQVWYDISRIPQNPVMWFTPEHKIFHWSKILKIEVEGGVKKYIATEKDRFETDMIILNVGMVPNKSLKSLRESALDFSLDPTGFMSEITLASGIFGCGSVRGPVDYRDTIYATNDVAIKVISLLSKDHLIPDIHGITIDPSKCGFCGLCATSCPYRAISIDSEELVIDQFKCKGCGVCVAVCPTKAIEMKIDTTPKMMKTIEVYSKFSPSPKIIAFACESCGYSAADDAGLKKIQYTPNVLIVKVPCAGRVDTRFITYSFEQGFDGVLVLGCQKESCKYIEGFSRAEKRIELLKKIAPELKNKLHIVSLSAIDSHKFVSIVNDFYKRLSEIERPTITVTQ